MGSQTLTEAESHEHSRMGPESDGRPFLPLTSSPHIHRRRMFPCTPQAPPQPWDAIITLQNPRPFARTAELIRWRMHSTLRFVIFLTVVLGTWTLMHVFVVWRVWFLPGLGSPMVKRILLILMLFMWINFPLSHILSRLKPDSIFTGILEWTGAYWIGVLFLMLICLFAADLLTGFGLLLKTWVPTIRWSALALAGLFTVIAIIQAQRGPVVTICDINLKDLPPKYDGMVAVQISDLHVGDILGKRWLGGIVKQVEALDPEIIFVTGDLVDGNVRAVEPLIPVLRKLKASLGTWAVTGNHEFYAGRKRSVTLLETAGFHVLENRWKEAAPGLVISGVDDLTARHQFGWNQDPVAEALEGRPKGTTVYLCHSPLKVKRAAELGADLMLSGHTHDGQIWPFKYLVFLFYPYENGFFHVDGMDLYVSRGTGTWGPPMRLFRRGEIVKIVFHSEKKNL